KTTTEERSQGLKWAGTGGIGRERCSPTFAWQKKKKKLDMAFIQESHLNEFEHKKLGKLSSSQVYYSSHKSSRRGVAILVGTHIAFQADKVISDRDGRYVTVIGHISHTEMSLINVYNPPEEGPDLVKKIADLISSESKGITIIAGDFNLILNANMDSQGNKKHYSESSAKVLRRAMKEAGIADVWRNLNPLVKYYTYCSKSHNKYSRLDYFFVFKDTLSRIIECKIHEITLSDHAPISLKICLDEEKGQTLWRFNNSLLQTEDFQLKINSAIKEYLEFNDIDEINPVILWEGLKTVIRGEIICFSSRKKKERLKQINYLEGKINKLEKIHKLKGERKILRQLEEVRNELNILLNDRVGKILAFTKQKYYDGGTKSLKILSNRLKKQQSRATVVSIRNSKNNTLLTKKKEIAGEFAEYYHKLYSSENEATPEQMRDYLQKLNLPQVTDAQNRSLTQPISTEEISKTIQNLKTDKSPGSDGFTSEFYTVENLRH
uniref:Endonuclease/exonuclease/phosphatase domain-containing protein n=1 Tax=Neogobius melanostomus TaxID=47308 RepID=A0A8C6U322_9GOBI